MFDTLAPVEVIREACRRKLEYTQDKLVRKKLCAIVELDQEDNKRTSPIDTIFWTYVACRPTVRRTTPWLRTSKHSQLILRWAVRQLFYKSR